MAQNTENEVLKVTGGRAINGSVTVDGSKNAALPLMTLPILTDQAVTLRRMPGGLADVICMNELLAHLGCDIEALDDKATRFKFNGALGREAPYDIVRRMRASILVLGPLLARLGEAKVSLPGGCAIGARPVDRHLTALSALGADIDLEHGFIKASAKFGLKGNRIRFDDVSVGATENAILAAVLAKGETRIEGAAREPEIVDLIEALIKMGAKIEGAGNSIVSIQGVDSLNGCDHTVIPDRLEAGSLMLIAAATRGQITINDVRSDHLKAVIAQLSRCGVLIATDETSVSVRANGKLTPSNMSTSPYPGFPTDLQSQYMAFMCTLEGKSIITENIFERRFMHVPELKRLGADIEEQSRHIACVRGADLSGAHVMTSDIRAGVGLIAAALAADGKTTISNIQLIDRGHFRIEDKLRKLGADIVRGKDDQQQPFQHASYSEAKKS